MKMFSTVLIPDVEKGMEYVVTAEIGSINPEIDSRPGPYYLVQGVKRGTTKKLKKANFKQGKLYNYADVILA